MLLLFRVAHSLGPTRPVLPPRVARYPTLQPPVAPAVEMVSPRSPTREEGVGAVADRDTGAVDVDGAMATVDVAEVREVSGVKDGDVVVAAESIVDEVDVAPARKFGFVHASLALCHTTYESRAPALTGVFVGGDW